MAIKVKHEGNVTSRVYAAAAGGKGKRQSEDAKVLLAAQQRGNGGGGTGGGARAGGNAPTMSAPTSHATLGSTGQMLSPPSMSFNQRVQLQDMQDAAAMDRSVSSTRAKIESDSIQRELDRRHKTKLQEDQQEWEHNQRLSKERRESRRDALRRQGYSDVAIMEIEEIEGEKTRIMMDRSLTPEQLADAMINLEEARERIVPQYEPAPDPNDPAQSIRNVTLSDGRKVQMIRDARGNWTEYVPDRGKMTGREILESAVPLNGTLYIPDGKGGLVPLENPSAKNAAAAAEKRNAAILKRAQEIVSTSAESLEGPVSFDDAVKRASDEYNSVYGAPPPAPPKVGDTITRNGKDYVVYMGLDGKLHAKPKE